MFWEKYKKKKLVFGISNQYFLPSIWNIFPEDNIQNNKDNFEIDTFQVNLYKKPKECKLLLITFNDNENKEIIQNEIKKLPQKYWNCVSINSLNELNGQQQRNLKKVFILKDITYLNEEDLFKYFKNNYIYQIFFIIITENKNIKADIKKCLTKFLYKEDVIEYFDINNIIDIDDYNKLAFSVLKIILYFNRIDDYDLIDFTYKNKLLVEDIKGLKEEID